MREEARSPAAAAQSRAPRIPARFVYLNNMTAAVSRELRRRDITDINTVNPSTLNSILTAAGDSWGLHPLGYSCHPHDPGPLWTTNWVPAGQSAIVYINVNNGYQNYRSGRISVIVDDAVHKYDYTHIDTGEVCDRVDRNLLHTRGVAVWSAPFSSKAEFLNALEAAHRLAHDPHAALAMAALIPPRATTSPGI